MPGPLPVIIKGAAGGLDRSYPFFPFDYLDTRIVNR